MAPSDVLEQSFGIGSQVHGGAASPLRRSQKRVRTVAWQEDWNPAEWREYLGAVSGTEESEAIRGSTHTGRPLGAPDFVAALEKALGRCLTALKGGCPAEGARAASQQASRFEQG
jgi:hypothetical protein